MGDKELYPQTDEAKEASYTIVTYPGEALPPQYLNYLISRYLRSLRRFNDFFALIDYEAYKAAHNTYFKSLLTRPQAIVKLAVLSDDKDIILGYVLREPTTLHYVYVAKDYQKIGIANNLLSEPFYVFTHITNPWLSIWSNKYKKTKFNPYI